MTRALYSVDHAASVRRIHGWLAKADPATMATGAAWYGRAGLEVAAMADASGFSREVCAAVVSHLSPQTRWEDNVRFAWHSLTADGRPSGCMGENYARACRAMYSDSPLNTFGPKAHKTRAFARAILGDTDAIVIDTWAVRAALLDHRGFRDGSVDELGKLIKRVGVYDQIADVYRDAARRVRIPGSALQAIVWGVIRGSFD